MAESFHACLHDLQSMGGRRRLVLPFVGRSQHNLQDNIMHVKCHKITSYLAILCHQVVSQMRHISHQLHSNMGRNFCDGGGNIPS